MDKDIINILKNNGIDIRYCLDNGKTYYVVSDLFKSLGYKNPSKKVNEMCHNYRKYQFPTNGGNQYFLCVDTAELIKLIMSFRKNHQFEELQNHLIYKIIHS